MKIKNSLSKVAFAILIILFNLFIIAASYKKRNSSSEIWIEAEDTQTVLKPLEIKALNGASNSKGIIASGNHFIKEGYSKYEFYVDNEGEYTVWARCFWDNACTNSFQIAIDNSKPVIIGEDPLMNQWHWVMGAIYKLTKGKHQLVLWNREENSKVDKFLVTSDFGHLPSDLGTSDTKFIYEDFETGKLPIDFTFSNKNSWCILEEKNNNNKGLFLKKPAQSNQTIEKTLLKVNNTNKYLFNLSFRTFDRLNRKLRIYFNYVDKHNYFVLDIADNKIDLIEANNGEEKILQEEKFNKPIILNTFQDISVKKDNQHCLVKFNGALIFKLKLPSLYAGFVGIGSDSGNLFFDNIALHSEDEINYSENFHYTQFNALIEKPETSINYFKNLKKGIRNWWTISGDWNGNHLNRVTKFQDGFEVIEGKCKNGKNGIIAFGDDFWSNYFLQCAAKLNGQGGLGVIFNFQNRDNYNLIKWVNKNNKCNISLIKVISGVETSIIEQSMQPLRSGIAYWYKIKIGVKDDSLKVYLDNKLVLQKKDQSFKHGGKAGLWTNSTVGASFDDIKVYSVNNLNLAEKNQIYDYNLSTIQLDISTSFSDWVPNYDGCIQVKDSTILGGAPCINKNLITPAFIHNKNRFAGNFKVASQTTKIPKDVDVIYEFIAANKNTKNIYRFSVRNDEILIDKNSQVIFSKKYPVLNRKEIAISHKSHTWSMRVMGENVLNFKDELLHDSVKVGIGYTGIGASKIVIKAVKIENLRNDHKAN